MEGIKLKSGKVQVRSGLVHVWFSLELRFNSLELDSEVGQLVTLVFKTNITFNICFYFIKLNLLTLKIFSAVEILSFDVITTLSPASFLFIHSGFSFSMQEDI